MQTLKLTAAALALSLLATASHAPTASAIGTVGDAKVGGNLVNTTLVNQNTNAAIGLGTKACSEIGSIGKSDVCG
jgi:hypothetical protein